MVSKDARFRPVILNILPFSAHHFDHGLVWIVDFYLNLYKSVHSFDDMLKWQQEHVFPLDHIPTAAYSIIFNQLC